MSPKPRSRLPLPEPKTTPLVNRKSSSEGSESPQVTAEVRKSLENEFSEAQSDHIVKKSQDKKPSAGASATEKEEEIEEDVSPPVLQEEDERRKHGRKTPRRRLDSRKGKRTESTDSDSNQQARGKVPSVSRKRSHDNKEKVDGTTADTEDHVSEDELKHENKRRRGTPSRRNGTMQGTARRSRKERGDKSTQQTLLNYVTRTESPSEGEIPTEGNQPGHSDSGTVTEEPPQVPTATTEDMLTVPVKRAVGQRSRSRRAIETAKRKRKVSERRQPRTSHTTSTEEECAEDKRAKLAVETEALPVIPQAKEDSEHPSSSAASDSGEESSEEGSDADHVPFLDLKEEPFEGDGFKHWDVVWAKCPGYPRYPAVVSGEHSTVSSQSQWLICLSKCTLLPKTAYQCTPYAIFSEGNIQFHPAVRHCMQRPVSAYLLFYIRAIVCMCAWCFVKKS